MGLESLRRDDGYDMAKFLACVAMLVNHCTLHMPVLWAMGFLLSRFVMPVFAFIMVSRLMENLPDRGPRLQRNLLLWGIPAQLLYMYFNRSEPFATNILWDLWVGVALIRVNETHGIKSHRPWIVLAVIAVAFMGRYLGYNAFLPIGMLLASMVVRDRKNLALLTIVIFGLPANKVEGLPCGDLALVSAGLFAFMPKRDAQGPYADNRCVQNARAQGSDKWVAPQRRACAYRFFLSRSLAEGRPSASFPKVVWPQAD